MLTPSELGDRKVHYWIYGKPGCGKTTFCNFLADKYSCIMDVKTRGNDMWSFSNDKF